jgi:uncharacterized protein YlbG (UPF0298 family)
MPAKQTINKEVKMLLDQKGKTCISIVLPLHNLTIDQKVNKIHLAKAVKEVGEKLKSEFTEEAYPLIESINRLHDQIEFTRNDEGIGLYISKEVSFYSTFPFSVSENIVIDKSFRLRELLMKQQYAVPYNVLYVHEREIRLFIGRLRQLKEIRNWEFPMIYEESYEYQPSSQASSYGGYAHVKSFERDKTAIEKTRHEAFIQQADDQLHKYLQNSELLILCGVTRYTSAFLNRTAHADKILSVLNGSYNPLDETTFSNMVWPLVESFIHEQMIDGISEYNEKIGEGLAEKGILTVWEAVYNGRADTLLIEKNYQPKGFLINHNSWQLYLKPLVRNHIVVEDAVNRLLEALMEKNGRVLFVEDGMLSEFEHIALITRYR